MLPELLSANENVEWSDTADVVVVGYGIAGVCAAIEARSKGADVLVIERASGGGGASALSGGIFYFGGGTPVQTAAGFEDSPDNMYDYLMASTGARDPEFVRRFCDDSVEHFGWLEQQGVPFERSYYDDKAVIPPGTLCLCDTSNENAWPYRQFTTPVPRGHKVATADVEAGSVAMHALINQADQLGVRTRFDSRVTGLYQDREGRICGVKLSHFDQQYSIRALGGVIIAAGGFAFNEALRATYLSHLPEQTEPLGIPNNDGDGLLLGQSAGADLQAMDGVIATASFYPPGKLIRGILVNEHGKRFVNEDAYHGRTADVLMEQPNGKAFLILDAEIFDYPQRPEAKTAFVDGFESIAEMESGLQLPANSLQATLADYNKNAAMGQDPVFHKHAKWLKPLETGPWGVFDVSYDTLTYVYITLGGMKTDAQARVLNTEGKAVAGLYAAGACAAHIPQTGKGYGSGMSLGPGSYYGRVAGRNAASAAA